MRSTAVVCVVAVVVALAAAGDAPCCEIGFEEHPGGTEITDQYLGYGVLFSGVGTDPPPTVFDYGPTTWGRVLISHDWYSGMRVDFVEPTDPGVYLPVSHIEFDNPIDSEVDYIVVRVFDAGDAMIHEHTSASPERVVVDLGAPIAAYMILDDDQGTAYVVDNLETDSPAVVFCDGFESGTTAAWSVTVP